MKGRTTRIFALISALVLAAGIMAVAGCGDSESEGLSDSGSEEYNTVKTEKIAGTVVTEAPADETGEVAAGEERTFTISATGDCTLGVIEGQDYSGSFTAYYDDYGADYFFDGVRDIFAQDDLTLVNLEGVLTTASEPEEKTYNMKGPPEYVSILTGSSIEACSLGNNHTYDYGDDGFKETEEVLDNAGITYASLEESAVYVLDDGTEVGLVSASLLTESPDRVETLKSQIRTLKDDGAALVIACCHWGIEKDHEPMEFQQETAHELIDAGADLVIGNHPHVLQGVEVYQGKVICYSLGNFCFGGNVNPEDKNTMIFQQTFTIADGQIASDEIDARIIPCRISSMDGYNDYQPTVATGEQEAQIIRLVNEYSGAVGTVSFDSEGRLLTND